MQTAPILLVALPLLAASSAPPAPAGPCPARVSALSVAAPSFVAEDELEYQELQVQYRRAAEIGSLDTMSRLLRENPEGAVKWVIETAELLANDPSERVGKDMIALKKGWERAHSTGFPAKMERYFSLLSPELKRIRNQELRPAWERALDDWNRLREEERSPVRTAAVKQVAEKLFEIGDAFEEVGDAYFASQCYVVAGLAFDEEALGDDAEPVRTLAAYQKVVELRESIELKDTYYAQSKNRLQVLERLYGEGAGEEAAADPEAYKNRVPGVTLGGPPITVTGTFRPVPELDEFERPAWSMDEAFMIWDGLYLGAVGTSIGFPAMGEASPPIVRTSSSSVAVQNAGGEQVEIPMSGRDEYVEITLPAGDGVPERRWGFVTRLPGDAEYYQGIEVNYQATTDLLTLFMAPAAAMAYQVDGVEVLLFDDNMDGVYGSAPRELQGAAGLGEGDVWPQMDSVVVDGADRAVPFSKYLRVGDQWYEWRSAAGGTQLELVPAEIQTGTLELKYKGPDLAWLIVEGLGRLEGNFFDLLAEKRGVELPIGQYKLCVGGVREGKRQEVSKALVLPGKDTPRWSVEVDGETEAELGKPFGFVCDFDASPESITVTGSTIAVTGAAGERYVRLWNAVVEPEVSVREVGDRKGTKPEDLELVLTQDELYDGGFMTVWTPKDLTLSNPFDTEDVQVQLYQKKHDLFGEIESEWLPTQ